MGNLEKRSQMLFEADCEMHFHTSPQRCYTPSLCKTTFEIIFVFCRYPDWQ